MTYKEFSVNLARKAGKIIRDGFLEKNNVNWKQDDSPVSAIDLEIDDLVTKTITETYPYHGLYSEEGDNTLNHTNEYVWVCDPLDGTYPYLHGIPTATFSLALVKNGTPILGVIYDPFMDRLYFAEKGQGAQLNNEPIYVSDQSTLAHGVIGISLWHKAQYDLAHLMDEFQQQLTLPVNLGANVYMGALLACGHMMGVIYNDNKPYDAAAVKIIVEEAGGKVTDINGNEQRYDKEIKGMVASNGKLHNVLLQAIQKNENSVFKKPAN